MPEHSPQATTWQVDDWVAGTSGSRIAVGRLTPEDRPVLLKVCGRLAQGEDFRAEFEVLAALHAPGFVRPDRLLRGPDGLAMIIEPQGARPFVDVLGDRPWEWRSAVRLVADLARALWALHKLGLVHGEIRPGNLLFDAADRQLLIADLSQACASGPTAMAERSAGAADCADPAEPWAYLSPAQTGRTGQPVDQRTDIYALGVLLYRMLVGRLPFDVSDPLEWIHCHLARLPESPSARLPGVPRVVGDIVLKQLAKSPDDRYQSAWGLAADLDRCLREARPDGVVAAFELGVHDASARLRIPDRLLGREAELARLVDAFDAVAAMRRSRFVMLAGPPGIGKTALAHVLRDRAVAAGGRFAEGKYDVERCDVPYSAVVAMLDSQVRGLLASRDEVLAQWRGRFHQALGINAGLAARTVPAMALLLGPTQPPASTDASDSQRRLHLVLRQTVAVLAGPAAPMVLFFDDVHAADSDSLALTHELLIDPALTSLLVVCACRTADGELPRPVAALADHLREDRVPTIVVEPGPLDRDDVAELLAITLCHSREDLAPLAQGLLDKAGGNPFFIVEFLRELHGEGLVWFDVPQGAWQWDLRGIAAKGHAGDVVELMLRRLQRLTPSCQRLLTQAACLGSVADKSVLAALSGLTPQRMAPLLAEAVGASIVQQFDGCVKFAHDRIREAAYQLTPDDERATLHLRAARLLVERLAPQELEERLFDVVHQFNRGTGALRADQVPAVLALNVRAARKARAASAFASARAYLQQAHGLLPAHAWETDYGLSLDIALELAECESLASEAGHGEQLLDAALRHARSDNDRIAVHRTRSRLLLFDSRYGESLASALEALRLLGIDLPTDDSALADQLSADRAELDRTMLGRRPADLLTLPLMHDGRQMAAMALLSNAFSPARTSRPALFPLLVVRAVLLAVRHGTSEHACHAFALYPRLLRAQGRLAEAYEFSSLSLAMADRLGATTSRGAIICAYMGGSYFLRRPYAGGLDLLQEGMTAGLQSGSWYDAANCALVTQEYLLESGAPLAKMLEAAARQAPTLGGSHVGLWPLMLDSWTQFVRALQGRTRSLDSLDDDEFSEAGYEQALASADAVPLRAVYLVLKQVLACLAGRHAQALELGRHAAAVLRPLAGMAIEITHRHYLALSIAASCPQEIEPSEALGLLEAEIGFLRPLAELCPQNFGHRLDLLEAERARIRGSEADAERLYERAIDAARRHGCVQHEAQAMERAAEFNRRRGMPRLATAWLRQAGMSYLEWGAIAKARALEAVDPRPPALAQAGPPNLDVLAVARASQALSSLIDSDELIDTLMRIAMEQSGAQTALLFLVVDDVTRLAAEAAVHGQQVAVRLHRQAESPDDARPQSVVNYVRRTRERVLLQDASLPSSFTQDPYFHREHPRSVMCLPLLSRSDLVGVLYLENRLSANAFNEQRVSLLEMLAAQAAISLETARLYAALRAENAERQQAERTAMERQARIQRLIDSTLVGVRFAERDGRIVDCNDAFLRIVGRDRDEIRAGAVTELQLSPPQGLDVAVKAADELWRDGRHAPYETEYCRPDGVRVPVLVSGTLTDGDPRQSVTFVMDLTERRMAEIERAARVAAEAANQAKSAFLAGMSHELRTPLNGILGYAQLLQMDPGLRPKDRKGVATIEASGRHLLALINDILDLARIEAGRLELSADHVGVRRLFDTLAASVRPSVQSKHLDLQLAIAPGVPSAVQADERRLSQILLNIVGNAVKFTDAGTVAVRLTSSPVGQGRVRLRFEVEDTGVGMSDEELATIFRPFEQVGAAPRRVEGTGLGLSITEALLRQMGGSIGVRSQPGRGTTFWFELEVPVLQAQDLRPANEVIEGYAGPPRRILVVDDVKDSRSLLVDLLVALGFGVTEATDGLDAIVKASARPPDLVLMDSGMPVMTGVEATQRLRADPILAKVPIIAVSAGASLDEQHRSLQAGASAFLSKPVDVNQLLHVIGQTLHLEWKTRPGRCSR